MKDSKHLVNCLFIVVKNQERDKIMNDTIEKIMKKLQEKFNKISKKGYIKGIYNSLYSIVRTFENELNLPMNKE